MSATQVTATIKGHTSAESAPGQTVTLTITKPDGTTATATATTTENPATPGVGEFSTAYTDNAAKGYSITQATVPANGPFAAGKLDKPFPFDLLQPVTVSIDSVV